MGKSRFIKLFIILVVFSGLVVSIVTAPLTVSAQDTTTTTTTTPPPPPELKLSCDVPSYSDNSGASFNYTVKLTYSGNDTITVNIATVDPAGWKSTITYSGKEVSSIPIGPLSYNLPDEKDLTISLDPNAGSNPDVGEYKMTLKAVSDQFSKSIDLTAIVKARYQFSLTTDTGNLATKAVSGTDNHFYINLVNTGSAALDNINLSVSKPETWQVSFSQANITSLGVGQTLQEDVIITPPSGKTVAGDYAINIRASNSQVSSSMDIRVTVETTSMWGYVSIVIIAVIIAGLVVLFLKLGRR